MFKSGLRFEIIKNTSVCEKYSYVIKRAKVKVKFVA